jgi:hypothetical protein
MNGNHTETPKVAEGLSLAQLDELARLRLEVVQLRTAIGDCNRGLNSMAVKIVAVGAIVGFQADQSVDEIAAIVRAKLIKEAA